MERVRFGIVGVGAIGAKHIETIRKSVPEADVTAVCIRSPERRRAFREENPDMETFGSAEELFSSGACDAVILCTPHSEHPGEAIDAFKHGLHVLTEKPAGIYTAQVLPMVEAAKGSGRVFGIMYNQRADPMYAKLREMVRGGELGGIKRITWIVTDWYRSLAYHRSSPWHSTWRGEGGGVLLNQSIHQLDLWQWIFGMPDRVWARAGFGKYHDIEVEDDVTAVFEYENGVTGEYITSTGETPGTNRLEVACDMGRVVCEAGKLTFLKNAVSEREFERVNTEPFARPECGVLEIPVERCAKEGHAAIIENFASAVLRGTPLTAPGEEGLFALTMANGALLSAWRGEWVDLGHFPHGEYESALRARF